MNPILQVEHLTKKYERRKGHTVTAACDISFSLMPGETLGIIGESGSGKTTLVSMIANLMRADSGRILFDGEEITNRSGKSLKELYRNMQMVFQSPAESFDPRRTLGDGVSEILINYGSRRAEAAEKTRQLFALCGLDLPLLKRYPHEVSGGQCQRAAIARAIALQPKLLILDEATSALDVTIQKEILELLAELKEKQSLSYLFICHDIALVQNFCSRVLVMEQGRIIEEGDTAKVLGHPQMPYTKNLIDSVI